MEIREIKSAISQLFEDVVGHAVPGDTSDFHVGDYDVWDSFAHMNLILAIEQAFSVSFSDTDIEESMSYDGLVGIVASKL